MATTGTGRPAGSTRGTVETPGAPPTVATTAVGRPAPGPVVGRVLGVEGLRAVAASSILVYHVWVYSSPSGEVDVGYLSRFALPHLPVGVTLFFALSGYLLYRPFAASILASGRVPSIRNYLRNRALRILPAYWVILLIVAVVLPAALVRLSRSEVVTGRLVGRPDLLVGNALLAQNYRSGSLDTGIGPAWSLAIEVIFYLVLPLLAVAAAWSFGRVSTGRGQVLALLLPPVALLLVGTAGKAVNAWLIPPGAYPGGPILARSFLSNADLFAPGMALAVLHVLVRAGRLRLPRYWAPVAWTVLTVDVLATVLLTDRGVLWRWGMLNPYQRMTALACVLLVGLVVLPRAGDQPSVLTRFLERRPLILCGLASYSLFLWHEPVTRLLAGRGLTLPGQGGLVGNLVLVAVLAGALAAATYRWVERPALARKVSSIRPESGTGAARRRRRAGRPHRPGGFSRKESAG